MNIKNEINEIVQELPKDFYIVGSYIRNKQFPQDMDIVTTNNINDVIDWFDSNIGDVFIKKKGPKIADFDTKYNNKFIRINIFKGTNEELPYLLFSYSYPKEFNISLRKKAKNYGLKLSQYGFYDKQGKLIKINEFNDVFKILDVEFRTPEEEEIRRTKYKNIKKGKEALRLIRQEKIRKQIMNDQGDGLYQDVINKYRAKFCNGKARPLINNEIHYLCSNYMGPFTELEKYPDVEPFNDADNCAKIHDKKYNEIQKIEDPIERSKQIRKSDKEVIECFDKANNGTYSKFGKYGILAKMKFEDKYPKLAKSKMGLYYGSE